MGRLIDSESRNMKNAITNSTVTAIFTARGALTLSIYPPVTEHVRIEQFTPSGAKRQPFEHGGTPLSRAGGKNFCPGRNFTNFLQNSAYFLTFGEYNIDVERRKIRLIPCDCAEKR